MPKPSKNYTAIAPRGFVCIYERVDKPRGEFFHTNWTGTGGCVASVTYKV